MNKYLVYNTSNKFHGERFKTKLQNLLKDHRIPSPNTGTDAIVDLSTTYDKTQLVTDLTGNLNQDELGLLAKGPEYSLLTEVNDNTHTELSINFYRLANRIRWKESNSSNNQHMYTYPVSKYISKPDCSVNLENTLKKLHHEFQHIISSIKPRTKWSNLSSTEKRTVKSLKCKPNIYLPSDKGGEFCITDKQIYTESALNHLRDATTYRRVSHMTAKTIEKKVNTTWKDNATRGIFPDT